MFITVQGTSLYDEEGQPDQTFDHNGITLNYTRDQYRFVPPDYQVSDEEKAKELRAAVADLDVKVAVMGCVVNGPGEAREADIGIAGGVGEGLLIRRGEIIRKVPESELLAVLREELLAMSREHRA